MYTSHVYHIVYIHMPCFHENVLDSITTEPHAHDIGADFVRVWLSGHILNRVGWTDTMMPSCPRGPSPVAMLSPVYVYVCMYVCEYVWRLRIVGESVFE